MAGNIRGKLRPAASGLIDLICLSSYMKPSGIRLVLILFAGLVLGACKIEHTKTVSDEPGGRTSTEHSVKLKETISDEEKGVELYKSRDEEERP